MKLPTATSASPGARLWPQTQPRHVGLSARTAAAEHGFHAASASALNGAPEVIPTLACYSALKRAEARAPVATDHAVDAAEMVSRTNVVHFDGETIE